MAHAQVASSLVAPVIKLTFTNAFDRMAWSNDVGRKSPSGNVPAPADVLPAAAKSVL